MLNLRIASWFVLLCTIFVAPDALACSCIPPGPPADELQKAAAVFAGEVVRMTGGEGEGTVTVTFRVSKVWKGPQERTLVVTTPGSSASCGVSFEEGKSYLVYAHGEEGELMVNLCSRTAALSDATEDLAALGEGTAPPAGPETVKS
jgi:hypothetical protein